MIQCNSAHRCEYLTAVARHHSDSMQWGSAQGQAGKLYKHINFAL